MYSGDTSGCQLVPDPSRIIELMSCAAPTSAGCVTSCSCCPGAADCADAAAAERTMASAPTRHKYFRTRYIGPLPRRTGTSQRRVSLEAKLAFESGRTGRTRCDVSESTIESTGGGRGQRDCGNDDGRC